MTITESGLAMFREVKGTLDPTRAALLEGFSDDELANAERLLERFFDVMGKAAG